MVFCQAGNEQAQLVPYAIGSFVIYTVGIPLSFSAIMWWHRKSIIADQELRMLGIGDSRASNPQFATRIRYQELYQLFKPRMMHWRIVLLCRKFLLVTISLMYSTNSLFQARSVVTPASGGG